ncbi:MAG: phosphoribosylformylglycinamidine cyclo-ligase [Bacillota bacterium]
MKYRDAGVDIDGAQKTVKKLQAVTRATFRPGVLGDIGGFGAFFQVPAGYREPVMVAGADGVGTKLMVAFVLDKHDTVGIDCVAMNADDVAVSGAEPLFFLDYLAVGKLDSRRVEEIVSGVAEGCRRAGCALIGGETAQMPGIYQDDHYDLAGFCVGVVERSRIIDGSGIRPGDALVALGSSGLHSNGYSLVRRVLLDSGHFAATDYVDDLGRTLGEELLEPTRIYALDLLELGREVPLLGVAHITGGGITENLPRVLPPGSSALVDRSTWQVPPVFDLIARVGQVETGEMYRVFNMGVGMILVVPPGAADRCVALAARRGLSAWKLGEVVPGAPGVQYV